MATASKPKAVVSIVVRGYSKTERLRLLELLKEMEFAYFWAQFKKYFHELKELIRAAAESPKDCDAKEAVTECVGRLGIYAGKFSEASDLIDKIVPRFRHKLPRGDMGVIWTIDTVAAATGIAELLGEVIALGDAGDCEPSSAAPLAVVGDIESGESASDEAREEAVSRKHKKQEWQAKAMITVVDKPHLLDAEIAGMVGIHPSQLTRSASYQAAARIARGEKEERRDGFVTTDEKTRTKTVEAAAGDQPDRGQAIPRSSQFREYCAKCNEPMRVMADLVGTKPLCEDCE